MAIIIYDALKRLLPKYSIFNFGTYADALLQGIATGLTTAKTFLDDARKESIPATAVSTIPEWHEQLGLELDTRQTVAQQQARINSSYTSYGGASLDYLQEQTHLQFPMVYITELESGGLFTQVVNIAGNVNTTAEYYRLLGFVQRVFPTHLQYTFNISVLTDGDTARTGIAMTGKAITGRIAE